MAILQEKRTVRLRADPRPQMLFVRRTFKRKRRRSSHATLAQAARSRRRRFHAVVNASALCPNSTDFAGKNRIVRYRTDRRFLFWSGMRRSGKKAGTMSAVEKISIAIPPALAGVLKQVVTEGRYQSMNDVVREALTEWRERHELAGTTPHEIPRPR